MFKQVALIAISIALVLIGIGASVEISALGDVATLQTARAF